MLLGEGIGVGRTTREERGTAVRHGEVFSRTVGEGGYWTTGGTGRPWTTRRTTGGPFALPGRRRLTTSIPLCADGSRSHQDRQACLACRHREVLPPSYSGLVCFFRPPHSFARATELTPLSSLAATPTRRSVTRSRSSPPSVFATRSLGSPPT